MSDTSDLLHRWCERAGIATGFHDIWGTLHEASDDGLRALLAELGITDTSRAALEAAEAADWRVAVPPVAAGAVGAPLEIVVRVPALTALLHWRVETEDGRVHEAELRAASLAVQGGAMVDGIDRVALRLSIDAPLAAGYHRLRVRADAFETGDGETLLIVAPAACYRPPALRGEGRVWGPAVQLYSLRSERNWGIGDFGDLLRLAQDFGARGAGIVGLNPLHALFPHNPRHLSPYSPSSRAQLNVLYLDVEAVEELRECEAAQRLVRSVAFQQRLARLREAVHVDYPGVSAAKFEVLSLLHEHFLERHLRAGTEHGRAFERWQAERGEALALHATFEALQARFHAEDASVWGWPRWPLAYQDPTSPDVQRFRAEHADRVGWFAWLQWQADRQLARVARTCDERGLAVGLYLDLAVSVDRAGSDSWAHAALHAQGATIGAPPDEVSLNGQDWGLPPLQPRALLHDRLRFLRETLRACMRHAGALRIDHVMGLIRLYWIPPGRPASEGAYVHYPLRELLAMVALESERNACMVIGEDLGTVADEMREALAASQVLSYRLVYFEHLESGAFKPPQDYPREALVAVSTHDLPTFAGWWQGHDIHVRQQLGLYPDEAVLEGQLVARAQERVRLLFALEHAGLLPADVEVDAPPPPLSPALLEAVHAYAAATPSRVMVMQLEDALGVVDQANLPGTVDEHPNWRQKLPLVVEELTADAQVAALCARLARLRPHASARAMPAAQAMPAGQGAQAVVPRATYRLQFHADFTFDDARAVLPYLDRLGISHVYCSPLMRARPGSLHGYDVVACDEISPELGGRAGFERFAAAARRLGMGLLLDMVPNHMGIGPDNAWWMDVLENGPASPWARFFDIDWHPADPALEGKVLLPVLGDHFGAVLDAGQLALAFDAARGVFMLAYWEHRFPVDPRSAAGVLKRAAGLCGEDPSGVVLASLAVAFEHMPPRDTQEPAALAERVREAGLARRRLVALADEAPVVVAAIARAVAEANEPGRLDALHEAQAYRLAFWRVASDEINYRRFFDVNELAALRQEDPAVFEATQGFALELAAAGLVDGLRIDHPDGLHDPAQYFERLQQGYARRAGLPAPGLDEHGRPERPLYVVAEKIAAGHEDVPTSWALHGTTGYRFANVVNGVLVDTAACERLDRVWRRFSRQPEGFEELAWQGKRAIMRSALASELTVLATELLRIARAHRHSRDYTYNALREALAEVAACMPVYRTYVVDEPSAQDVRYIDWAVGQAQRRSPAADPSIFGFVRRTLLAQAQGGADAALRERVRHFAMRFQQFSSPVAAKGVEDTAFYRYHRLLSLNEVGGDPGTFGLTLRGFHAANADRAARWPHTLIATSTHDNKRSEDVRCRLDVLSEMPSAWRLLLSRIGAAQQLQRARAAVPGRVDEDAGEPVPSRSDEYLLLQTLLGTLPAGGLAEDELDGYRERIERYVVKALRESKQHTSWIHPNADYEAGALGFVRSLLARVRPNPALTELQAHADALAWFGAFNSASMAALKFTAPGVPDVYQGNETMDLSLVDPDNRRPVDYAARARLLHELHVIADGADWRPALRELVATPWDGRLKLWITWRLLRLRRERAALYRDGGYAPLRAAGEREEHVVAFARELGGERAITVAGRFHARLAGLRPEAPTGEAWGDTWLELPDGGPLFDVLAGVAVPVEAGRARLADVFATLPVAVLVAA